MPLSTGSTDSTVDALKSSEGGGMYTSIAVEGDLKSDPPRPPPPRLDLIRPAPTRSDSTRLDPIRLDLILVTRIFNFRLLYYLYNVSDGEKNGS